MMNKIKLFKNKIINIGENYYYNIISHFQIKNKSCSKFRLIGAGFRNKQGIKLKIRYKNG